MDIIQGFDPCVSGSSPDETAKDSFEVTNVEIVLGIWHFIHLLYQ